MSSTKIQDASSLTKAPGFGRSTLWISALVTLIVGTCTYLVTAQYSRGQALAKGDGMAYFLYAQSIVLDFDGDVTREFEILEARTPQDDENNSMIVMRIHGKKLPQTGKIALPWPIGIGIVMAPFYALGYGAEVVAANLADRPVDIFGLLPQLGFSYGSLFYGFGGFWFTLLCCRRAITHRESDPGGRLAWLSTLTIILAGPTVFYIFFSPAMAHAATFGFVALMVLLWWRRWDENPATPLDLKGMVWLGLIFGITITLRYQCVMFAPLLIVLVLRTIRRRSWVEGVRQTLAGLAGCSLPLAVQGLHYVSINGWSGFDWRGSEGFVTEQEKVYWFPIHFLDVLFSCRHGAFYWAPILLFGVLALVWVARSEAWARVFLLTFFAHLYLIGGLAYSYSAGLSFGMRFLVEQTPFLAAGLAATLASGLGGLRLKNPKAIACLALFAVLIVANGLLILAFGLGTISGTDCVTHGQMVRGIGEVFGRFF